jgi:hypothetical protein
MVIVRLSLAAQVLPRRVHDGAQLNRPVLSSGRGDLQVVVFSAHRVVDYREPRGKSRARPHTVLRLSRAFDMSARRMQGMCSESWATAHPGEQDSENAA